MITESIQKSVAEAIKRVYGIKITPEITFPDPGFGDLATNVAFRLGKELKRSPVEVAEELSKELKSPHIQSVNLAGTAFINIKLKDLSLVEGSLDNMTAKVPKPLNGKVIVTEYSDPNPFKELHAGHLYTSIVGESISKLLEAIGATVHRVNFGGDVGMHVAKAMWGILEELKGENLDELEQIDKASRPGWLSVAYTTGATAFESDESAKKQITEINKRVYELHITDDHESAFARIYWTCRQWSYDYFEDFYAQMGTRFEKYYPESSTMRPGVKEVKKQLSKGVFEISDGAVVFKGEPYNLHTRVFITSSGLPTYEAKDIGLALLKWHDYKFDETVIITGNDITEYMKVILKALEQFEPKIAERTKHLPHGIVKLKNRGKMSSRKGNVLTAVEVIEAAAENNRKINSSKDNSISLAAIKYSFLKQQIGGDIMYDPAESVSLTGNSGPYLQYAYTRINAILHKAKKQDSDESTNITDITDDERELLLQLMRYPQTVELAATTFSPHVISNYLYQLAQSFNSFYEKHRVLGDNRERFRLRLIKSIAEVLLHGLSLLNIEVPEQM